MDKLFQSITRNTHPKIIAIGKNYVKHVKEMGGADVPKEPVIFTKPFSSIVLPGKDCYLPKHKREIHHETELGFMIGKGGRFLKKEDWKSYVGGYFLALDLTDRDLQWKFKKQSLPWDLAKGQDFFLPISNFVSTDKVTDPNNLELLLKINGKKVQNDVTSNMYFKIPQLIEYVSQYMTLNSGDLFLTGTPSGVGPLKENDKVEAYLLQQGNELTSIKFSMKQE